MPHQFAVKPPGWLEITSTERMHLFTQNSTKSFTLSAAGPAGGTYEIRAGITGTVVQSGSIASLTTISIPTGTCGYFLLYLYGTSNHDTYGTALGEAHFTVYPTDSRFKANPVQTPFVNGRAAGVVHEGVTRGVFVMGPQRHFINTAATPTVSNASGDGSIANVQANVAIDKTWYSASGFLDTARPRELLCQFPGGTTGTDQPAGVTQVVTALYPDVKWFEGPANEPQGVLASTIAADIITFADAVHAGNASAKVLVPNPVSINASSLSWYDDVLNALGTSGRAKVDGYSIHTYNSIIGDLALAHRCFDAWQAILVKYGEQNKPRWQTEQGSQCANYGAFMPGYMARHTALQLLISEQYGIPKERNHYWYDSSHGFWGEPYFWESSGQHIYSGASIHRTWSAELFGKTHTSILDFGEHHKDLYCGSLFTNATTGDKVLALLMVGMPSATMTFTVTGAGALTQVDAWGNTSTVTVANGRATVTVADLTTYVRLPSGVTATLLAPAYGDDLAALIRGSHIVGEGTIENARIIGDGHRRSGYYFDYSGSNPNSEFPYFDATLPATIPPVTFEIVQRIDRARVWFAPPRHEQCTALQFSVETLGTDGVTWTQRATVGPLATNTISRVSHESTTACKIVSWFNEQWIFDLTWSVVECRGLRVVVQDTTYGMATTPAMKTELTANNLTSGDRKATVRKVQAFSEASQVPRVTVVV